MKRKSAKSAELHRTISLEFTAGDNAKWRCPYCKRSVIRLKGDTLHTGETRESLSSHQEDWFEPEHVDGRFTCLFTCPNCDGSIAVGGVYRIQDDRYSDAYGDVGGDYVEYFRPHYFSDPPPLFDIPDDTPDVVMEDLRKAFRLYWLDEEACGNRIRTAVEQLLTISGIAKTELVKKGAKQKRSLLTLHRRIERFQSRRPDLANQLFAIKWIGNAGSHASGLKTADLEDGFLLLEHVLKELYGSSRRHAFQIAKTINKRKKPRSAKKPQK